MLHPFAFGALWALTDWIYTPSSQDDAVDMMLPEEHDILRIRALRAETGVELRDVHSLMNDKFGANNVNHLFDDVLFAQCCPLFASSETVSNVKVPPTWYHHFMDAACDAGVDDNGDAEIICVFVGRRDVAECPGRRTAPIPRQYLRSSVTYCFDRSIRFFSPLRLRLHFTSQIDNYQIDRYGPYPKAIEDRVMMV